MQVTDANNLTASQPLSIVVAAVITALSPVFGPVGTNGNDQRIRVRHDAGDGCF